MLHAGTILGIVIVLVFKELVPIWADALLKPPYVNPGLGRLDTSPINWRLALGNQNSSHQNLGLSKPKGMKDKHIGYSLHWRPQVTIIGDNLAVNLTWRSQNSLQKPVSYYRVQFRQRKTRVQRWSKLYIMAAERLNGQMPNPFFYITNKQPGGLEADHIFQFRIFTIFHTNKNEEEEEEKSAWSTKTSFAYISPVPPLVNVAQRMLDGSVVVKWTISRMRIGFPIDQFILLFRKERRLANGETGYSGFQYAAVRGDLEEYSVTGLDSRVGYQFVVYGVHHPTNFILNGKEKETFFTGGLNGRKITAFSQEVFVPADPTAAERSLLSHQGTSDRSHSATSSTNLFDMNSSASNSLMFLILGVLVGFMLVVMMSLVAVCFFRQRREKLRLLAPVNGGLKEGRPPGEINAFAEMGKSEAARQHLMNVNTANKRPPPQNIGFLLSDLTPIAVANFRTATTTTEFPSAVKSTSISPSNHLFRRTAIPSQDRGWKPASAVVLQHLTNRPLPPSPPKEADDSCSSANSPSTSMFDLPTEMKREPPSGGSIHDESEADGEMVIFSQTKSACSSSAVFFTQLPLSVSDYRSNMLTSPSYPRRGVSPSSLYQHRPLIPSPQLVRVRETKPFLLPLLSSRNSPSPLRYKRNRLHETPNIDYEGDWQQLEQRQFDFPFHTFIPPLRPSSVQQRIQAIVPHCEENKPVELAAFLHPTAKSCWSGKGGSLRDQGSSFIVASDSCCSRSASFRPQMSNPEGYPQQMPLFHRDNEAPVVNPAASSFTPEQVDVSTQTAFLSSSPLYLRPTKKRRAYDVSLPHLNCTSNSLLETTHTAETDSSIFFKNVEESPVPTSTKFLCQGLQTELSTIYMEKL